jgi:hypothetical protein
MSGKGKNGVVNRAMTGATTGAKTRDAGLIIARSEASVISDIFTLPPEERQAKLIEYVRKQHDEAEARAREQIRLILDGE